MSERGPGSFAGVVALHEQLIREPDPGAAGDALHPGRLNPPQRWTPVLDPLVPYAAESPAALGLSGHSDFHAIPDAALARAMLQVVDVEGPVHFEVLADRLLAAAGAGRLGARIRARIEAHLETLAGAGALARSGAFAARRRQLLLPPFRDWREAPAQTRVLDHVHDHELMLCLFRAVMAAPAIDTDTAMNEGLHRIGFIRLTRAARARLAAPLQALVEAAMLVQAGGRLTLGPQAFLRPAP